MEVEFKQFLRCWLITLTTLLFAVAVLNVLADPYRFFGMPPIKRFNEKKRAAANQGWLYKAYEVNHIAPKTVLSGSSRVQLGIDAKSLSWPEKSQPVYNLGIEAAIPYVSFRYLQNLMSRNVPDTVIIGLDFEYFLNELDSQHTSAGNFETRLSVNVDGTKNQSAWHQRIMDFAQFSLSYDSLSDSVVTVIGNILGDPSDTEGGNEPDRDYVQERVAVGTFPFMEWLDVMDVRRFDGGRNQFAMADLQSTLDLCTSHGTKVILYIHPMPADTLEVMDLVGYWPVFENWKRDLLGVVVRYRHQVSPAQVVLWDFSDYDAYSTESVRRDHSIIHWYWESWHYTKGLGDLIVERMLGESDAQFGTVITEQNLEPHLANIREKRRLYRASHQEDVERIRAVYSAAASVLKGSTAPTRDSTLAHR